MVKHGFCFIVVCAQIVVFDLNANPPALGASVGRCGYSKICAMFPGKLGGVGGSRRREVRGAAHQHERDTSPHVQPTINQAAVHAMETQGTARALQAHEVGVDAKRHVHCVVRHTRCACAARGLPAARTDDQRRQHHRPAAPLSSHSCLSKRHIMRQKPFITWNNPHAVARSRAKVEALGFRHLNQPVYSPDHAIADFHFFSPIKKPLRGTVMVITFNRDV